MQVRRLGPDDADQARALGVEAFGGQRDSPSPPPPPPAGRREWGAFDAGRLVAKVVTHDYHSWWSGRQVATCGVAGVAVSPEHRGRGLLRELFDVALGDAVERGQVLSTLYPTANGIYRGLGYELVASYDTVEVPTAELARVTAPVGMTTRRATQADLPAVAATYAAWAAAQNGPLTRTGPRFEAKGDPLDDLTAITLALDVDDRVVGYLAWDRGRGYGPEATLSVRDLIATSADAYRALWLVAASFASVTGRVRLSTSGADPARLVLPSMTWDVTGRHPYLLRVLDLPGAVAAIGPTLPDGATATVGLTVVGDRLGRLDGDYRLTLGDGPGRCERTPPTPPLGGATLTPQGLALLVSGAQSCGNLRLLAHLCGPDTGDRALDAAFGGRQLHVRDYF